MQLRPDSILADRFDGCHYESRTEKLRAQVCSNSELSFLMEAHDGLSAGIADRAGFKGLWASGSSIACSLGFGDTQQASWTQVLDQIERIVDSTQVPVLVDGRFGFGSLKSTRLLARKLHQRGAAGLSLEASYFPKVYSFVGEQNHLAHIDGFLDRLRAVKDAVAETLVLVARIEAPIDIREIDATISRAHAYADAGADAILVHSSSNGVATVLSFADSWQNRLPILIDPTKCDRTSVAQYRAARISAMIWTNHLMRAAATAIRQVSARLISEECRQH